MEMLGERHSEDRRQQCDQVNVLPARPTFSVARTAMLASSFVEAFFQVGDFVAALVVCDRISIPPLRPDRLGLSSGTARWRGSAFARAWIASLAAPIDSVDPATRFHDHMPKRLIKLLTPASLIKGGD